MFSTQSLDQEDAPHSIADHFFSNVLPAMACTAENLRCKAESEKKVMLQGKRAKSKFLKFMNKF